MGREVYGVQCRERGNRFLEFRCWLWGRRNGSSARLQASQRVAYGLVTGVELQRK
jgi:hypothetical protein